MDASVAGPNVAESTSHSAFHRALSGLAPGYFALVMGTGIVSVGMRQLGLDVPAVVLLAIAAIAYVVLWVLFIWRAISHREAMLRDLRNPELAFAYFTVVAGTDVLAVGLIQEGLVAVAMPLFGLAAVLWFVFGYVLPWQVFMTRDGKPILARTNGTWFIWAVASQSLAIGMAQIQPHLEQGTAWVGILAVLSWTVGVVLYVGVAMLVLLRIVHFGITPREFEPPYWVAMGAMAIAVVAGTNIVDMESTPMVDVTRTLIAGTVVAFWSFCIWLIPMLVGAGVWRHLVHRVPFTYTPALWSIVFPVGMIAVASIGLGRIDNLPLVESIGNGLLVVASVVWTIVFVAMMRRIIRVLWETFGSRGQHQTPRS